MQEHVTLALSPGFQALSATADSVYEELSSGISKVQELISAYYFNSRGSISGVSVDKPSLTYRPETGEGTFLVRYTVGLFNACADLRFDDQDKMTVGFKIAADSLSARLTGEYIPEREPDEF
jgi:hypothetical protein